MTIGFQKIDVVATNVVLGKTDNGGRQTLFTVMVCSLFRHVTSQLRDLDLLDDTLLETTKQDLSLTWFETIGRRWNRSNIIGHREEDELLVDKVRDWHRGDVVVKERSRLTSQRVVEQCS